MKLCNDLAFKVAGTLEEMGLDKKALEREVRILEERGVDKAETIRTLTLELAELRVRNRTLEHFSGSYDPRFDSLASGRRQSLSKTAAGRTYTTKIYPSLKLQQEEEKLKLDLRRAELDAEIIKNERSKRLLRKYLSPERSAGRRSRSRSRSGSYNRGRKRSRSYEAASRARTYVSHQVNALDRTSRVSPKTPSRIVISPQRVAITRPALENDLVSKM